MYLIYLLFIFYFIGFCLILYELNSIFCSFWSFWFFEYIVLLDSNESKTWFFLNTNYLCALINTSSQARVTSVTLPLFTRKSQWIHSILSNDKHVLAPWRLELILVTWLLLEYFLMDALNKELTVFILDFLFFRFLFWFLIIWFLWILFFEVLEFYLIEY